jgi:hypothetical protein
MGGSGPIIARHASNIPPTPIRGKGDDRAALASGRGERVMGRGGWYGMGVWDGRLLRPLLGVPFPDTPRCAPAPATPPRRDATLTRLRPVRVHGEACRRDLPGESCGGVWGRAGRLGWAWTVRTRCDVPIRDHVPTRTRPARRRQRPRGGGCAHDVRTANAGDRCERKRRRRDQA